MQLAAEKKFPCLFHSDGNNFSNAKKIYDLAKRHKNVPVILGHSGCDDFDGALNVMIESVRKKDAKLYCDISWLNWENGLPDGSHSKVKTLIEKMKSINALDRILFGTDAPLGCFGESLATDKFGTTLSEKQAYEKTVSGLKTMIKNNFASESDEIIDKIFYQNAQELFFDKKWAQAVEIKPVAPPKFHLPKATKAIALIGLGIAAIGTLCLVFCGKNNSAKSLKQTALTSPNIATSNLNK